MTMYSDFVDDVKFLPFIFAVLFLLINMSFTFKVTSAGREAIHPSSAEFGHVTEVTPT